MHQSPTLAYRMPDTFGEFFSNVFGFDVVLCYLGAGDAAQPRPVLGNVAPNAGSVNEHRMALLEQRRRAREKKGWLGTVLGSWAPGAPGADENAEDEQPGDLDELMEDEKETRYDLTFADCAPYLLASLTSLSDVAGRLPSPEGANLDVARFRPNLVIAGAAEKWEEDFWGEVGVLPCEGVEAGVKGGMKGKKAQAEKCRFQLTANCVRCASLNVDYATGEQTGTVLKSLQKDRRVDRGQRYAPVFGRYGFLDAGGEEGNDGSGVPVSVGDRVVVTRRNEERTQLRWPGMGGVEKGRWWPGDEG